MAKYYPSHHPTEDSSSSSSDESEEDSSSSSSSSHDESEEDSSSSPSSSSSHDESKEGNNDEQENPKAASLIKKRKSDLIKKPEAVIKKQDKPRKTRKKRKIVEEDDTEETLQLLLQHLNNGESEIPPPVRIVTQIPNEVVFSKCIFKQLSESDVDGNKCRLVLGNKQVKEHFFCHLEESEIPGKEGVDVLVYGSDGKVYEMTFKTRMGNIDLHVLMKGWSKFLKAYRLQKYSDFLKIWMFKASDQDGKICFVIDSIRFDDITKPLSKRILKNVFQKYFQETKKMAKEDCDKPRKTRKKRKFMEFEDREETLQLLLQQLNNEDREIPPPVRIVSKIPNEVEFSRCIYKQLSESDVNGAQSRLLLGNKQVEDHFICRLEEYEIPGKEGVDVLVYGPDGEVHQMTFKIWIERSMPLLMNGWGKFVKAYGFRKYSDVLKIWMFKTSDQEYGKICFVIDSIRFDDITKQLSKRILKNVFQNFQETKNMAKEDSSSSSSDDESEQGNNGEQESPKASAVIKKRKSVIKKPEAAAIKKQRKPRKMVEEDDREETLELLLERIKNNGEGEKAPPDWIVSKIPNHDEVEFSRCIYKQLTESDVNGGQRRLTLGKKQVEDHFLCYLEESEIPGVVQGVDVLVYGPDGKVYEMKFKIIWIGTSTPMLMSGWSKFVEAYGLQKYSDVLKIWMFRASDQDERKICFVIDSIRFDDITKPLSKRILKNVFQNFQETKINMAKDYPSDSDSDSDSDSSDESEEDSDSSSSSDV